MSEMTYADARNIQRAIQVLEGLERSGEITAAEQAALDRARGQQDGARMAEAETAATYRGVQKGLSFNLLDEGYGAFSALTGGDYATGRADVRQRDDAAALVAPDAFQRGEIGGGLMSMLIPGVGGIKATQGMGLGARTAASGLMGGGLGFGFGFADGRGFGDRVQSGIPTGIAGALTGIGGPLAGAGVGKLVRGVQDSRRAIPGYGAQATQAAARGLQRSQEGVGDIQGFLDRLGDDGMLADVPGGLRSTAQGLAVIPGEGSDLLRRRIMDRAEGSGGRIRDDADSLIAGPNAAFDQRRALATERRTVLGPEYEAAKRFSDEIDVADIVGIARSGAVDEVGPVAARLKRISDEITLPGATGAGTSAARLHNIRSELSDDITVATREGRGNFVAAMRPILERIDNALDGVPGYAAARTGYANNKAMERAIEDGRAVFRGGEVAAQPPAEIREMMLKMTEPQREAFRRGSREYIDALMGTARNDAAAAWGAFSREWNAEKLRIVLGKKDADRLIQRLEAENIFSNTRGRVLEGSDTQARREAARELGDFRDPNTGTRPGPLGRAKQAVDDAGNSVLDTLMYGPGRQRANLELAQILSAQGPQRTGLLPILTGEANRIGLPTRAEGASRGLIDLMTRMSMPAVATQIGN